MRALGKLISGIIAVAMVGVVALRVYYQYDLEVVYHEALPEIANTVIVYAVLGLKALTALFIMVGGKKSARFAMVPLLIVIAETVFLNLDQLVSIYEALESSSILDTIQTIGLDTTLWVSAILSMGVFGVLFFILALFGGTRSLFGKILLILFALAPLALIYGTSIKNGVYLPAEKELIMMADTYGLYFAAGLMIFFAHTKKRT